MTRAEHFRATVVDADLSARRARFEALLAKERRRIAEAQQARADAEIVAAREARIVAQRAIAGARETV
jgi:hypothetical protein